MRTRIGECFGIFFCRSSESSSGGSFFVAWAGNRLLFAPRHVTGANAAAKATVSTSARNTVVRIIAVPRTWGPYYLNAWTSHRINFYTYSGSGAGAGCDGTIGLPHPAERGGSASFL